MSYPLKKVSEIFKIKSGNFLPKKSMKENGDFFVFGGNGINGKHDEYNLSGDNIIIGRVGALCGNVRFVNEKLWLTDNAFYISEYLLEVDKKYLSIFLSFLNLGKTSNSSAQPVISYKSIQNLQIPLPPLPTQKAIVQKLDEAFARIDASIELAEKSLKAIEEGNASVLEEVFGGGEYEEKSVEQISKNIQYGYTGKTTSKGKVRYLRITDIQNNAIYWENVPYVEIEEREISKYSLNCGDIVFARTGATVGKSCLIDENGIGNIFASYLIRIVSKLDLIFPEYLQYFFYSQKYWEQIGLDVVGAAQPNFNGTKLKQIKLPLPPLSKQKEIVEYLDRVFEGNKKLKESYEQKIASLREMKQSLLREAFEGRLVRE